MATTAVRTRERRLPAALRRNARHLVWDIAGFGVLNGSAIAFVAVYASRLGADAWQIGLLSAGPAIVNLAVALPAGSWLQHQQLDRRVFQVSLYHRLFYLAWVLLPLFLAPGGQIWVLVLLTLAMSIPGTALGIGFNALYAETVPPEWRSLVAGRRNAAFAGASIVVTLLSGWLLDRLPFPVGYQLVFALGLAGALFSSYHLSRIKIPPPASRQGAQLGQSFNDWSGPGNATGWQNLRTMLGLRAFAQQPGLAWPTTLRQLGPYRRTLALVVLIHLTLYLAVPLFPLALVQELGLTDQAIGLGHALFYVAVLVGSTQLDAVTRRLDDRRTLALGLMLISLYPGLISQAGGAGLYWLASVLAGLAWALSFGALPNYVLAQVPADRRPTYLAWYNMALQAGILIGSALASALSGLAGVLAALLLAALCRLAAGLAVWRWG